MLTEEEKNAGLTGRIIPINIEEQMKSAYIDYSMSVIVSRALPDVRDGMKPVHRRILYDMSAELNLYSDKPTRKSARIVGDVLGKFHPHGDMSVYDAMVRLAQDWSMRYPLVDGQGNFGSMDGDSPAAMRYTEARMKKITDEVMADIDKETVDWTLNFAATIHEPTVLPTKIPLLIVNGASGIAVGMATNMAPHNLSEVVDACCAYIDNPEITGEELLHYVKGPDFPTGGIIYGYEGVKEAMLTGRGRVMMRAKTDIEHTPSGRECIVITEIPYMINKAEMIKKIADMINDKKIDGISYINDESDRNGLRIIIILKHDAVASVVLNTLFKNTPLLLWIMFTFFVAQLPPLPAAVLAFTLFTAASVAEIVRGGLASVPAGQYEAARSQGFSAPQMYLYIILPQALRNMVPALLSQFVTTIKDTSYLWGAMALQELMGRGMILMNSYNSTVQIFAIFGLMALIYFVVCFTLSQIVRAYQRRLKGAR